MKTKKPRANLDLIDVKASVRYLFRGTGATYLPRKKIFKEKLVMDEQADIEHMQLVEMRQRDEKRSADVAKDHLQPIKHVELPYRKIVSVQISTATLSNGALLRTYVALCADGTLWEYDDASRKWSKLPDISALPPVICRTTIVPSDVSMDVGVAEDDGVKFY